MNFILGGLGVLAMGWVLWLMFGRDTYRRPRTRTRKDDPK